MSSAAGAEPSKSGMPVFFPRLSFFQRFTFALKVWLIKAIVRISLRSAPYLKPSQHKKIAPNYVKRYSVKPQLQNHIFLPKNYTPGTKLPLYINIHGGGFVLGDPSLDDQVCRHWADELGYCVASINYRKAPLYAFPTPVYDCAELIRAVLSDEDLPVGHDKVVLGGFSAGANLILAVSQFDDIRNKINGVFPVVPVVDLTKRNRGEYRPTPDGREDNLKHSGSAFSWAYVPAGTDLADSLLSPFYASQDKLPKHIYFVGAEYDALCKEANLMAKRLAGIEDEPDRGREWTEGGIKWEMIPDLQHGFTHDERDGQEEIDRKRICNELYARIDAWIKHDVFADRA